MKLRILFTTVLLMAICSVCSAAEAYANYYDGTLTFYYDNERSSKPGTTYDLNTGSNTPGWITAGKKFKRVEFVSSFADYRPTSTYDWFYQQSELTTFIGLSYLKTDNVKKMGYMFYQCSGLTSLNLSDFDTSEATTMEYMFYGCSGLTSLDLSGFDTGKVTDMRLMFYGCSSLTSLDVSGFDTSKVTNMRLMFYGCSSLTSLDVSDFDTGKVTDMYSMFRDCTQLKSLDVSGFDTSEATTMEYMFSGCSGLTSLDLSGFDTGKVTVMRLMFDGCSSLTSLNLSNFDTSNVTNMGGMFLNCNKLTSLDLSGFDTGKVTNMKSMFECAGLMSLDLSNFDTSNVTDMSRMFRNCSNLTNLNVSGFNTANVTNMNDMFYSCSDLTCLDVSGFDTHNVSNMGSMFDKCAKLTSLDLSGFNTANVTYMFGMFYGCIGLTSLDVSGFDTGKVTDMRLMFNDCKGLTTIYVGNGWNTNAVTSSNDMFNRCTNLKGGKGTIYDSSHIDYEYARIDGGPDSATPGYFTRIVVTRVDITDFDWPTDFELGDYTAKTSTPGCRVKSVKYYYSNAVIPEYVGLAGERINIRFEVEAINGSVIRTDPYPQAYIDNVGADYIVTGQVAQGIMVYDFVYTVPTPTGGRYIRSASETVAEPTLSSQAKEMNLGPSKKPVPPYTAGDVVWIKLWNGNMAINTGDFEAGRQYGAVFTLTANSGYQWHPTKSKISINGEEASMLNMDYKDIYASGFTGPFITTIKATTATVGYIFEKLPITIATGLDAQPQDNVQCSMFNDQCDEWFTIDGQKLNGMPTKKGIYIHNGKKVVH